MSMKSIRPLLPRDPGEVHRAATTLELLFDLISVIAIAAVTAGLHHGISEGHGLDVLPRFVFLFVAIWWAWMNFTWFASAFDNDDALYRLLVLAILAGALMFAGGVEFIFKTMDFRFALLGWVVMRLGMIALWLRAAAGSPAHRTTALRYAGGIALAQLCWCAMYVVSEPGSAGFYALGVAIFLLEFSVPVFAEHANITPFHRHHMIERYGLLMIITLGEIMLSVSLGFGLLFSDRPTVEPAVTAVAALVIVYSLWWIYFCERDHLRDSTFSSAFIWGYGHVFIFGAAAAAGAAIAAEVDLAGHHSAVTQADVARWLGAALAVIHLSLWLVRDRMLPVAPARRAALPVMAVLFLAAGVAGLPAWAFAVLSALAVWWRAPVTGGDDAGHARPDGQVR